MPGRATRSLTCLPAPDGWQLRGIGLRFRDKPQHVLGVFLRFLILALGIGVTGSVAFSLGLSSRNVPSGPARQGHPKAPYQSAGLKLCLVCVEICTREIGNPPTANNLEPISNKPPERCCRSDGKDKEVVLTQSQLTWL